MTLLKLFFIGLCLVSLGLSSANAQEDDVITPSLSQPKTPPAPEPAPSAAPAKANGPNSAPQVYHFDAPTPRQVGPEWNIALAIDYDYPAVSVQYALSENYAIGFAPGSFHFVYNSLTSTDYGALITLNGYSDSYFDGLWVQAGGGVYASHSEYHGASATQTAYSALLTAGYRFRWEHVNIGGSVGAQYFDLQKAGSLPHAYYLTPTSWIEFGYAF